MTKETITPAEIEHLPLPFSPAIRSGDFVFVSGQASVDERGAIVSGTFAEEMRRSMENLRTILAAAGCGLDDVVQVRSYVHDLADLAEYNELYREYFGEPLPARTTLTNCLGPIKFEIDAIARVRASGGGHA
jgi:2-iminobutanoate/2-iminopropanoate deaminase